MEHSLIELIGTVWELDRWELRQKAVMQTAESLILLINCPRLSIEFDFDNILSIGAMVKLILHHPCICDLHMQGYLEEDRTLASIVFSALFDMIDKNLTRVENVAELALHGNRVLKNSLVDLNTVYFLCQLSIALLNTRYSFR